MFNATNGFCHVCPFPLPLAVFQRMLRMGGQPPAVVLGIGCQDRFLFSDHPSQPYWGIPADLARVSANAVSASPVHDGEPWEAGQRQRARR